MKLVFGVLFLVVVSMVNAKDTDLLVLDIDGLGPESLSEIKTTDGIAWWVELGDKLLVAQGDSEVNMLFDKVSIAATLKGIKVDHLAFHVLGHCDHSAMDELLHERLDVVYAGQTVNVIDVSGVADKDQLLGHDSILPFSKNQVLTYQLRNRDFKQQRGNNNQVEALLDQVDKDRWFSQVSYLAALDRMLEADLNTAGQWLEDRFTALGLTTSRVSLHNHYRGSNVLGFKPGSSRADEWYVVGAHMDSRNRTWDNALPSPGAEDNASGCSGVLEMANVIASYPTEASILFVCFIEEESGLLGSQDVVTQLTQDGDLNKVQTMLNLDMISYRGPDRNTAVVGTKNSQHQTLANTVAANGNQYTDIDWQVNLNMCCTDFVSFADAGVPAVTTNQPDIFTYAGYHTTQDLASNLDPDLAAGIIKANLATLIDMVGVDFTGGDLIFVDGFDQ